MRLSSADGEGFQRSDRSIFLLSENAEQSLFSSSLATTPASTRTPPSIAFKNARAASTSLRTGGVSEEDNNSQLQERLLQRFSASPSLEAGK